MKANVCKHFNGYREPYVCDAGCSYNTWKVDGQSVLETLPCFLGNISRCEKMELPTESELADYEYETDRLIANAMQIDAQISDGETEGSFECKYCNSGTVTWVKNPVRAKCDSCGWGGVE